jgi:hypothetical protein
VYPSALSELLYYRKARWGRVFHAVGFEVVDTRPTGVFYTGYGLVPVLTPRLRRALAGVLGSASMVFVLRVGDTA